MYNKYFAHVLLLCALAISAMYTTLLLQKSSSFLFVSFHSIFQSIIVIKYSIIHDARVVRIISYLVSSFCRFCFRFGMSSVILG